MPTVKAKASTITVGDIALSCYMKPDGSFAFSLNQLKSLNVLIGNSTGKKYAEPLVLHDNPSGELTKIEGQSASAKLISLDCFSAIVQVYAALGNHKCLALCIAAIRETTETRATAAFGLEPKTIAQQNDIMSHWIQETTKADRQSIFEYWTILSGKG